MWVDLLHQVVGAAGSPMFSAVALQGGQLLLYTQRGRRMLGALALGSTAALLCSQGLWHLLVVSTTGTLKVFNLQKVGPGRAAGVATWEVCVLPMTCARAAATGSGTHHCWCACMGACIAQRLHPSGMPLAVVAAISHVSRHCHD